MCDAHVERRQRTAFTALWGNMSRLADAALRPQRLAHARAGRRSRGISAGCGSDLLRSPTCSRHPGANVSSCETDWLAYLRRFLFGVLAQGLKVCSVHSIFEFLAMLPNSLEVGANCDHLNRLRLSPALPYAFTEHGAIMAAAVLNSARAIEVSV